MNYQTIANTVANIHNALSEISVKGEDVIRMAGVLQACRDLVQNILNEQNKQQEEQEVS